MTAADDIILLDRPSEGVAVVTFNRPDELNALSRELHARLDETLTVLDADDAVRAIVLTGAGDRAFSAGYDIKEQATYGHDEMLARYLEREPWMWHVASAAKPIIAAVNGFAWGGGSVIATAADIRVGSSRTSFRVTAVTYGGVNASWNLPAIVGIGIAKEWLLTAREVHADELHRAGWLNHLVEPDQVLPKAIELASLIADNAPPAVEAAKALVNGSLGRTYADAQRAESMRLATDLRPGDARRLFSSFLGRSDG